MILGSKWRKTLVLITVVAVLYHFHVFDDLFDIFHDDSVASQKSEAQKQLTVTDRDLLTQFRARDLSEPPNPGSYSL